MQHEVKASTKDKTHDFICVSEQVTGFNFAYGEWKGTEFEAPKNKYNVRYNPKIRSYELKVLDKNMTIKCQKHFDAIYCDSSRFVMSEYTLRFIYTAIGHANKSIENLKEKLPEDILAPHIEIGSCSIL